MCKCTPEIRTPFCGKPNCYDPKWNAFPPVGNTPPMPTCKPPREENTVIINKDEYDRLKRMGNNVKENIKTLDEILNRIEQGWSWNNITDDYYNELKQQKRLLESLSYDDEKKKLQWSKSRAYEFLDRGDVLGAFNSFLSDIEHTKYQFGIFALTQNFYIDGHYATAEQLRKFIEEFN